MQRPERAESAEAVLHRLRAGFNTGITRPLDFRRSQLLRLRSFLIQAEEDALAALHADLNKCRMEGVVHEIGFVHQEISYFLNNLDRLARPKPIYSSMGETLVFERQPKGVILVIGAYNFPVVLAMRPIIGAIAAGNAVVLKPSEVCTESEKFLSRLADVMDARIFDVVCGGKDETIELLEQHWDHIVYTGNPEVGKSVMVRAAKHLTPVTLELGGKSPVFILTSADIQLAASGVVFGRFTNSGQTCIACDYVLCEDACYEEFMKALIANVRETFGKEPVKSAAYGRLAATRHYDRVMSLIEKTRGHIVLGGSGVRENRYIEPTIVAVDDVSDALMQHEIFGPVLPVLRVSSAQDGINFVNSGEKPLALYVYGRDTKVANGVISLTTSGSAAINAVMTQSVAYGSRLGGVGNSGIGAYGFETSFNEFSHHRPVQRLRGVAASIFARMLHQSSYFDREGNHNDFLEKVIRVYLSAPLPKHEKPVQDYARGIIACLAVAVLAVVLGYALYRR